MVLRSTARRHMIWAAYNPRIMDQVSQLERGYVAFSAEFEKCLVELAAWCNGDIIATMSQFKETSS